MLLLSKLNTILFGFFDPELFCKMMKINIFWADLSDVSAKKEALRLTWARHFWKFVTEGREIEIHVERFVERGFS